MKTYRITERTLTGLLILAAVVFALALVFAWPAQGDTGYTPAAKTVCWFNWLGMRRTHVLNPDAHPWNFPSLPWPRQPEGGYSPQMHEKRYGFEGRKQKWCAVTTAFVANEVMFRTANALAELCQRGQWGSGHDCVPNQEEVTDAVATGEAAGLIRSVEGLPPKPCCECSTGALINKLMPARPQGGGR